MIPHDIRSYVSTFPSIRVRAIFHVIYWDPCCEADSLWEVLLCLRWNKYGFLSNFMNLANLDGKFTRETEIFRGVCHAECFFVDFLEETIQRD